MSRSHRPDTLAALAPQALTPQALTPDQAPSVTSTITFIEFAGIDGLVTGTFQGYSPQSVTGSLVLAVGGSAGLVSHINSSADPLNHVAAASPVQTPTVLADLAFSTPAQGADNGSATDIGIASNTSGFSALTGPLIPALAGTALGSELTPLLGVAGELLPGYGKNGGRPAGGSTTAAPWLRASVGLGLSGTTTILGITSTTHSGGTLTLSKTDANAISGVIGAGGTLLADGATLLQDVQSGNLLGAVTDGVATIAAAGSLTASAASLIATAASGHGGGTLGAVHSPALSLDLATQDSQSYGLGIGTPLNVSEQLDVSIVADKFGAYALGEVLAKVLPQVIADYGSGGVPNAASIFEQLAQGASALTQTIAAGGLGGAPGTPSLGNAPDISITATLVTGESQAILGGTQSAAQTFSLGIDSNAQALYDLGTAGAPVLTDLLVALLETPQGQEALQIGGAELQSIDSKFGGGSAASATPDYYHHAMSPIGGLMAGHVAV